MRFTIVRMLSVWPMGTSRHLLFCLHHARCPPRDGCRSARGTYFFVSAMHDVRARDGCRSARGTYFFVSAMHDVRAQDGCRSARGTYFFVSTMHDVRARDGCRSARGTYFFVSTVHDVRARDGCRSARGTYFFVSAMHDVRARDGCRSARGTYLRRNTWLCTTVCTSVRNPYSFSFNFFTISSTCSLSVAVGAAPVAYVNSFTASGLGSIDPYLSAVTA